MVTTASDVSSSGASSICRHKAEEEEEDGPCLLSLLASRNGTTSAISSAINNGAIINEVHPSTEEGVLHVLLRRCVHPFELFETLKVLVTSGADVNLRDYRGATPLSLLILHVNHGLRYHGYHLPEVKRMEDLRVAKSEIVRKVCGFDEEYQHQVYLSLELLLASGADVNAVPDVIPALPASSNWAEAFEHKLMQQEGRWHLLGFDTSMEYSTYNIFSPVSSHRCPNITKLTPLHLASWRGDALIIELLLQYGANAKSVACDPANTKSNDNVKVHTFSRRGQRLNNTNICDRHGRGMLHLLYLYCNKPQDLTAATQILLRAGTDPNLLYEGQTAAHVLIRHVFVKRSYIQYLSNAYTMNEINIPLEKDNFIAEIITCFNLLRDRSSEPKGRVWDSMLNLLYKNFQETLANTDKDFQVMGHYLVPYTFKVEPLTEFSSYLISEGTKVNLLDDAGETPLLSLIQSFKDLCVSSSLNSVESLCSCVRVLLKAGADCNQKDNNGRTPVHLLTLHILSALCERRGYVLDCLVPLVDLLTQHGADLNCRDNFLNTPLSTVVNTLTRQWRLGTSVHMLYKLTEELVVSGADPSTYTGYIHYPLNAVLDLHASLEHRAARLADRPAPPDTDQTCSREDTIHKLVCLLCGVMTQADLLLAVHTHWSRVDRLFTNYIDRFQSEASECETCLIVYSGVTEPFSLKQTCRRAIWLAMDNGRFKYGVVKLPLPTSVCQYLTDFSRR